MGWEDRPYYRDRGYSSSRISGLFSGSVPLFTVFGIRVRAHNMLLLLIFSELFLDWSKGYGLANKLVSMGMLFGIILLHEFGHCIAARAVGGMATDIVLWPLGGLAYPDAPERPGMQFLVTAGGPLVNVLICLISAGAVWLLAGHAIVSTNPLRPLPPMEIGWHTAAFYCWWAFVISYLLLLFNLLPIYPLDGGRMVQEVLWKFIGLYKSKMLACVIGMGGSTVLGLVGLWRWDSTTLMFLLIAASLFFSCYQERMMLREMGAGEPWQTGEDPDLSAISYREPRKRTRVNKKAARIARNRARREAAERQRLDAILAKVSATGIASLGWRERRVLHRATERRRKIEMEMKHYLG